MKNMISARINEFILQHSRFSIITVYNIVTVAVLAIFYPILPIIMGYSPDSYEISKKTGLGYDTQYLLIMVIAVAIGTISLLVALRGIDKWDLFLNEKELYIDQLRNLRKKCINLPYFIYIFQILFLTVSGIIVILVAASINKAPLVLVLKIIILGLSMTSLTAIISYIFSKRIFTAILYRTYVEERVEGIRLNIGTKLFLQILPMFIVAILFTGALSYSKSIEEKGDLVYHICNNLLQENINRVQGTSPEQIFLSLPKPNFKNFKISYFTIINGEFTSSEGYKPSAFFNYFLNHPIGEYNNRIFGDTNELQGVIAHVHGDMGDMIIGIKYELTSPEMMQFFFVALFLLLIMFIFILRYISNTLSQKITIVAESLSEIVQGEHIDQNKRIPVMSNDEISDLIIAFNKIRELQLEYDKLKTEFIVNVSHELRTPVNVMYTSVQLLEKYAKEGDPTRNIDKTTINLKGIKQNCLRLIRLINNLIDTARMDAGFLKLQLQPLDIAGFTKEITESIAEYAKSKDISLKFDAQTDEKVICCDVDKIERIILNLLSNAIKFTNRGGSICVKVNFNCGNIILSVKDTGIGIPKGKQKIIFERFRQVDQSLVRSHEGSGIGLSLVKQLVEMHKGKIRVESEEGTGSEFIIELPVKMQCSGEIRQADKCYFADDSIADKIKIEFSDIYISN